MVNERIPRVTGKIFASNAAEGDIGQFGSALTGTKVATDDISIIQALPAYEEGWRGAVVSGRNYPTLQEMNGLQKTLSQQINYLLQNGMAEWDAGTTYFTDQFCRVGSMFYVSLEDNNLGNNPTTTTGFWKIWNPAEGVYANNDLSNLSEAGEAHFANPDLSNLSAPGLDKINQSKALETGSVSSDADVYADIQKYAHSTFDLSKFEVVGSPNITDDGVASGFNHSNYINFSISLNNTQKIVYYIKCIFNNASRTQVLWSFYTTRLECNATNLSFKWNNVNIIEGIFQNTLQNGDIIEIFVILNDAGQNKIIAKVNGQESINTTNNTALTESSVNSIRIGDYVQNDNFYFTGSIDLKSFAIWVDGVPVFSGNKTGIDVIKPDNFVVVGTPTITEDGIASGFGNNNSFKSPISFDLTNANSFEVHTRFKFTGNDNTLSIINAFGNGIYLSIINQNILRLNDDSSGVSNPNRIDKTIEKNLWYNVIYGCTKDNLFYLKYKTDLDNSYHFSSKTITSRVFVNALFCIGILLSGSYPFMGEIDLNTTKVYINDNLVYQPCLKIPYTESKTGSKIVDAAYRDRVQDMYEQFGYAPYYTIDEENQNFTLPMGEIYGMIERKNDELNNPFSLFDYKYADAPIYNMSWLQANGNWYAKSVYISAYEALVVENNSDITAGTTTTLPSGGSYTKRGLSVKLSTDSYTDTDFVINTTDETFRLPLKAALTPVTGGSIPVIGNGMAMGLINGYNSGTFTLQSNTDGAEINVNGAGQTLPYNAGGINRPQNAYVVGLSKDPAISGVIADISGSTGLYLYYYVGETTQSSYIINNLQKLNNDAGNLTEPGKINIKNLVYPDFNNTVSLDITLNLVQQADKDCYLHVNAGSNSDLSVDICDADGVTKLTLISSDTVANVATIQTSPLIPAGTYFKVSRNVGSNNSLTKIYTTGESNV